MNGTSIVSGGELPYNGNGWRMLSNMTQRNCYDYAFGDADTQKTEFGQPVTRPVDGLFTCEGVERGMMIQHPETRIASFKEPCAPTERKIALMVDPVHPSDYHYLRQDADGIWSHKPGYQEPRRVDASGNVIVAPHLADMHYQYFNYTNMCNYYCIPASRQPTTM